jgi:branched-chain amino acid aminotransferase
MAAAEKAEWVWLDGRFVPWAEATIHVATEAVIRAASVFEGVRAYGNADQEELYVFRLPEHLRRLRRSARLMHMVVEYSDEALTAAFRELIRRNGFRDDVHFRPTVYFGEGESGASYLPEEIRTGMFCIAVRRPHTKALTEGVHAGTSTWRRNADDAMPSRIKAAGNYHNSRLAHVEARRNGYGAALMLNGEGKVAEGPAACFMMVRDGRVVTPPVTADILESITRETLIALLRAELGLEVQERDIDRSEVYAAEEAFFCGSGAEVTPVVSLDRYPLGDGAPGPLTRRIQRLYFDVAEGRVERYRHWLTPVYRANA